MTTVPREERLAEAVRVVQDLLGEKAATKVQVEVTRGGTFRIVAEAGDGAVKRHEWKAR